MSDSAGLHPVKANPEPRVARGTVSGFLVTVATLALVELLSHTPLRIPDPSALCLLAVVFSAFTGGRRSGLLSAATTLAYALTAFSEPGDLFHYAAEDLRRLAVLAVAAPLTALLVSVRSRRPVAPAPVSAGATERYHDLVQDLGAIVWEADATTWRFSFVSQRAEAILGYPIRRWLAKQDFWVGIVHPEDRQRVVEGRRRETEAGRDHELTYRAVAADERVVWLREIVRVIPGPYGRPGRLRGVMVDVTGARTTEEDLRQDRIRLGLLNSIWTGMGAGLPVEEVIEGTLRRAREHFPALRMAYSTIDEEGYLTVVHSVEPPGMPQLTGLVVDLAVAPEYLRSLRGGKPLVIEDVARDARLGPLAAAMLAGSTRAVLDVPLRHAECLVGLLCFDSPAPRKWSEHEIATLVELAEGLGIALRGARSDLERKKAEEEIRLLQTMTVAISEAGDLQGALGIALMKVCEVTGWILGQAWIPREDGQVLECSPAWYSRSHGLEKFRKLSETTVFHPGIELPGRVWLSKQPAWVRDVTADPDFPRAAVAREVGLKAGTAAAVLTEGQVVAVLEFMFEPRAVDDRFVELVSAVAAQLGWVVRRKRAEEALKTAEERLRTVIRNAPIVLFALDREGMIRFSDGAGLKGLGLQPGQSIGQSVFELYRESPKILENVRRALGGEAFTELVEVSGQAFETRYAPLRDARGGIEGVIGVATDVTQQKILGEQLRQAQKMEAVGRLAGGISHDFNNLLTAITGYSELLLLTFDPEDPRRGQAEEIRQAAERAGALTHQLLAFSRRQVLESKVLDLNAVVSGLEPMLRRVIGEDIELITVPGEGSGRVRTDPGQIEQVIMNLTVNARDAMPHGGKIILEAANVQLDAEYATRHVGVRPGPYVMLALSDTGTGMEPETLAHLFEPFFTTKGPGKGTGLGLSTVYGIVKQSGGNIWAYSEPGRGTTFKIYLPRVDEALEPARVRDIPVASTAGEETILLVEDERVVRGLAVEILQRHGYSVLEARHGAEALQVAEKYPGPIHLMLTDVVMPYLGGPALAERLASLRPEMKVLFMSGYTGIAIAHQGALDADREFLQKPFTVEGLARKVREVLDASRN